MDKETKERLEKQTLEENDFMQLQGKLGTEGKLEPEERLRIYRHNWSQSKLNEVHLAEMAEYAEASAHDVSALLERFKKQDEEGQTIVKSDIQGLQTSLDKLASAVEKQQKTLTELKQEPSVVSPTNWVQPMLLIGFVIVVCYFALKKMF